MPDIYIASAVENYQRVREVANALRLLGWTQTYDWTRDLNHKFDPETMQRISGYETQGVSQADLVLVLLPGGRGTHFEFGLALGLGLPIVLCGVELGSTGKSGRVCPFHYLPSVRTCRSDIQEIVKAVTEMYTLNG